jgi:diguanylate cyclase (GGDEF)-like protein
LLERGALLSDDPYEAHTSSPVLLVTADPRAAQALSEMLRAAWADGPVVAPVERLADAAQQLLDHAARCVLLDLSPGGLDPVDGLEQIRTAAPDVPVIVICDQDDHERALRAVRAGAQDFLPKADLDPVYLRRSISYAIERKRSEVQLAHQALHDGLTQLPNRALFLDRLGVALDRLRRSGASVAVLFLDIDNFKQVNDSLGHAAGDRLLTGLADRMRAMLRPMDTVARFGGDEFTFLFEDLGSEREVVLIAERLIRAASAPIRFDARETSVTVSIGIAMVADPSTPVETVIREADAAMYRAKELGRSRYELFDEASRQRAMTRITLEAALRHALERGELRVHYQPNVGLREQTGVLGVEALVRWEHPHRGLIAPRDFVPLAEETGMMIPIGQYVLEQALSRIAQWHRYKPDITVSVNVSSRQLEDAGLASMLADAIRGVQLDPRVLCLEITEMAVARNPEVAIRTLDAVKAIGVRLAIDDFGAGPSSLASLRQLPIDTLKIDRSVVNGLGSNPREGQVVAAVVNLGHALGLHVVAEGVETDAQLRKLREVGCDAAQGFLIGRPVPEEQVGALLLGAGGAGSHRRSRP